MVFIHLVALVFFLFPAQAGVRCTVDEIEAATVSSQQGPAELVSVSNEQFFEIIRALVAAGVTRTPDLFRTSIARGQQLFGLPFSGRKIFAEAKRRFGSWPEALRLASVQRPRRGSLGDRLSAENLERLGRVLAARNLLAVRRIREMTSDELVPLFAEMDPEFPSAQVPSGSALLALIEDRFDSLNEFVRRYSIGRVTPPRMRWSKDLILSALRAMSPHMSLINSDVRRLKDPKHPALIALRTACDHPTVVGNALIKAIADSSDFASWDDAVRQALASTELSSAPIAVRRMTWTRELQATGLRALVEAHAHSPLQLSPDAMNNHDNPSVAAVLVQALRYTVTPKAFYLQITHVQGAWEGALLQAGLPADQITWTHQESQWTRAKVTALLRALNTPGQDLHPASLRQLSVADILTRAPTVLQILEGHSTSGSALYDAALRVFGGHFLAAARAAGLPFGTPYVIDQRTDYFFSALPRQQTVDEDFVRQLSSRLSTYLSADDIHHLVVEIRRERRVPSIAWITDVLFPYLDFLESYARYFAPPPEIAPYAHQKTIVAQALLQQGRALLLLSDWMVPIFRNLENDAVLAQSARSPESSQAMQRATQVQSTAPILIHALLELHRRSGLAPFQTRTQIAGTRRLGPPRYRNAASIWRTILEEMSTY